MKTKGAPWGRLRASGAAALSALLSACSLVVPFDFEELKRGDGGAVTDAEADSADVTVEPDVVRTDADDDHVALPGPMTLVVSRAEVTSERLCDLDGDGVNDNSMADLGAGLSDLFAAVINQQLDGFIGEAGQRVVIHSPWVDDVIAPSDPDMRLIVFSGADMDRPADDSDDFSGTEPFRVKVVAVINDDSGHVYNIDACGEPLYLFAHASVDRGVAAGSDGMIIIPTVGPARGAEMWGTIDRRGSSAEFHYCAHLSIRDLGAADDFFAAGSLSGLEALVGGGPAFGVPTIPGMNPDLDLDGDGLERVLLDDDHQVEGCLDGDGTLVSGSDCWADPRMADAFSVVMTLYAVSAAFGGLGPNWSDVVPGTCPAEPEESLWDPS